MYAVENAKSYNKQLCESAVEFVKHDGRGEFYVQIWNSTARKLLQYCGLFTVREFCIAKFLDRSLNPVFLLLSAKTLPGLSILRLGITGRDVQVFWKYNTNASETTHCEKGLKRWESVLKFTPQSSSASWVIVVVSGYWYFLLLIGTLVSDLINSRDT